MRQFITTAALVALLIVAGWQLYETKCSLKIAINESDDFKNKYLSCLTAQIYKDTVYITKTVKVPEIRYIKATDSILITQTITEPQYSRFYQDSIRMEDLTLHYQIQTAGKLKWTRFKYDLRLPKVTEGKIIYQDRIVEVPEKQKIQLYAACEYGITDQSISFGTAVIYNGVGVNYKYDLMNKSHSTGVLIKIK